MTGTPDGLFSPDFLTRDAPMVIEDLNLDDTQALTRRQDPPEKACHATSNERAEGDGSTVEVSIDGRVQRYVQERRRRGRHRAPNEPGTKRSVSSVCASAVRWFVSHAPPAIRLRR